MYENEHGVVAVEILNRGRSEVVRTIDRNWSLTAEHAAFRNGLNWPIEGDFGTHPDDLRRANVLFNVRTTYPE